MRISDWSSDVCSSDLEEGIERRRRNHVERRRLERRCARAHDDENAGEADDHRPPAPPTHVLERKSVVKGKSVSVRVDLGGRRIIKKQRTNTKSEQITTDSNDNVVAPNGN